MMLGALAVSTLEQSSYDGVTLRLLLHLMRTTDSSGLITATQKELAKNINTSQASVSRALKKLTADHHVYKRGRAWFLNPETAFHGTSGQHQEAVQRTPPEKRLLSVVKPLHRDEE
jgi:DNA-binding IclR family transcriptional regulator